MFLSLFFAFACHSPVTSDSVDDSHESSDSVTTTETGDSGLTDSDSGPHTATCREDFSPIGSGTEAYCFQTYEPVITGSTGDHNPYLPGAVLPSGIDVTSTAGVIPTTGISWAQAKLICEQMGWHLATVAEWRDAADGVIGDGGTIYPYGNKYDADACAENDNYPALQPTGSLSKCVSPWGVYDQDGNAWEWVDPEETISNSVFMKLAEKRELHLSVGSNNWLYADQDALDRLHPLIPGFVFQTIGLDDSGAITMTVDVSQITWDMSGDPPTGYIHLDEVSLDDPTGFFMARAVTEDGSAFDHSGGVITVHLELDKANDNEPMTGKVGGAYYTPSEKNPEAPTDVFTLHTVWFDATAVGRCATSPN